MPQRVAGTGPAWPTPRLSPRERRRLRRRGSAAGRRRSRPAVGRRASHSAHCTCSRWRVRLPERSSYLTSVRVPWSSRIAAYVPRTVRRSEPPAPGRAFSITIAVAAPLVPGVVLGPRRSLGGLGPAPTAFDREGIGARQPQAEAFPHRAEVAEVGLVHLQHRAVLDELHPAGPRAADPPPGQSAVSHGSREIDDVRRRRAPTRPTPSGRSRRTTGRPETGRTAAGRSCRGATQPGSYAGASRSHRETCIQSVGPRRIDGDDGSPERRDAEDPRTHPAMVVAGDRGMLPMEPLSRSRLPSGARSGG